LPSLDQVPRGKRERAQRYAQRALADLDTFRETYLNERT
jgi:folate-dependent tRNA-U54 methylase TrmFO/GidA